MPVSLLVRVATLAAAALVAAGAGAVEPPNPKDLTQGVWDLDLKKSKFCKPTPRSGRREIVDLGWNLIGVHWTGIDANGKPIDVRYVWRYDGGKYPATIMEPANEAISWKLVNPSRVEFVHWSKDDKKTEELVRTVSADGQEMQQTRSYLGGAECIDVQVFKRVAGARPAT
jgi:hypothetical protein